MRDDEIARALRDNGELRAVYDREMQRLIVAATRRPPDYKHPVTRAEFVAAYSRPRREKRGITGGGQSIEEARDDYVQGRIDVWEFERRVGRALGLEER